MYAPDPPQKGKGEGHRDRQLQELGGSRCVPERQEDIGKVEGRNGAGGGHRAERHATGGIRRPQRKVAMVEPPPILGQLRHDRVDLILQDGVGAMETGRRGLAPRIDLMQEVCREERADSEQRRADGETRRHHQDAQHPSGQESLPDTALLLDVHPGFEQPNL